MISHLHHDQHSVSCGLIIFFISVKKVVEETSKRLDLVDWLKLGHFFVLIKLLLVLTDISRAIGIVTPYQISTNCVSCRAFTNCLISIRRLSCWISIRRLSGRLRSISPWGFVRVCVWLAGGNRLSASVYVYALVACSHKFSGVLYLTRQLLDRSRDADLETFLKYDRKNDEEDSHSTD